MFFSKKILHVDKQLEKVLIGLIIIIIILIIYTIILLKSVCLSVGVRKLQIAILARSPREMTLTVRIV